MASQQTAAQGRRQDREIMLPLRHPKTLRKRITCSLAVLFYPLAAMSELAVYVVPDVTMKELLDAIPVHCFKRSALRSSMYTVWHLSVIGAIYKTSAYLDTLIDPAVFTAPHPLVYSFARFALWSFYGFATGLFATGIWVIGHEAGHQAFSESKLINNTVGWILHSAVGVPYHSWRITHAKHHASTGHMTQDQVWVPKTRSQAGRGRLPPFDPKREDRLGARASLEVQKELKDALGDSPIGAVWGVAMYLLIGWPMYIIRNASGQRRYPKFITNHFNPNAVMFSPHHYVDIVLSAIGVGLWIAALVFASYTYSFRTVFTVYLVPYLWVNHWLVLITFLQHTDPLLPHYRAPQFNFQRGALSTLDRSLLGDLGSVAGWIGAHATCGISETHVAHHVCSKIPHYHAWEATEALREKVLRPAGIRCDGAAGGWAEMYRVFRECRFVEDEGDVVFYKNARGLAKMRPAFNDLGASDSGVEIVDGKY
ncbi:fatty acid desaturase-domain-containing protein [Mycena amicta]|nr:fatty acid desaturase-domain-containing protein [Mycena amicta]